MTNIKALAMARKLWGKKAAVQKRGKEHSVGTTMLGAFFEVRGEGETWEDAFANASKGGLTWSAFDWPPQKAK